MERFLAKFNLIEVLFPPCLLLSMVCTYSVTIDRSNMITWKKHILFLSFSNINCLKLKGTASQM